MQEHNFNTVFKVVKEQSLFGRYINTKHILPLLEKHRAHFKIEVIGASVLKEDIFSITIGSGKKKILMWSQMHGNESTTTKAIFDLLNFFTLKTDVSNSILETCTIKIIPILNPDGAKAYTRFNANAIDLNRDAQSLTQPESKVLRDVFNDFKPDFCFNLHGQRTIFSAGNSNNTAALSFLSPAQDQDCTLTDNRKIAMSLIVSMNRMLQKQIPNQVGIYDDAFNLNCVGDTFQSFNVPTILFEAGHVKNDYNREEVRQLVFQSYLTALNTIVNNTINVNDYVAYLEIPQNEKLFYDIIIKNVKIDNTILDIAIQYKEQLKWNKVCFVPKVEKIESLKCCFSHKTIEANGNEVVSPKNEVLKIGNEIDLVKIKNEEFSLKTN